MAWMRTRLQQRQKRQQQENRRPRQADSIGKEQKNGNEEYCLPYLCRRKKDFHRFVKDFHRYRYCFSICRHASKYLERIVAA